MYTIKQAAALAGVTPELLRAWERRYGIVRPARTPTGYRLYDEDAVARLQAMRRMIDAGWTASQAAADVAAGRQPIGATGRGQATADADPEASSVIGRFVDAAARVDTAATAALLDEMFASGTYERVASQLLLPAMVEVGRAWQEGRLSVAAEHAASAAVMRRLAGAFEAAGPEPATGDVIVLGLPPGSRHEVGALSFAVGARRAGLPVVYVGADLPVVDWISATARARAAVIGVITDADAGPAMELARELRRSHPTLVIALGGRAAPELAGTVRLPELLPEAILLLRRVG